MPTLKRPLVLFILFTFVLRPAVSIPASFNLTLRQTFGNRCTTDTDCGNNLLCFSESGPCPPSVSECFCVPGVDSICVSDDDCRPGTTCEDFLENLPSVCLTSEDAELVNGVCVDARALRGMPPHELVFENHWRARVLCDEMGSCATKGHMVSWQGNPMMMATYCEQVGCVTKTMMVNSPRWKRALKLDSRTDGLQYLAFAARYETKTEERLIKAAVRMGL